jgi:hypothetical protein
VSRNIKVNEWAVAEDVLRLREQVAKLERENTALLDLVEDLARQHCYTGTAIRDYNGQVAGTLVTDSGALTTDAIALRQLAKRGRFRVVAEHGRMVVGYWPENEPRKEAQP